MTKGEIAKLLAVLAASYPKFEVDDLKVQVWHEMLGDLDYTVASMAIKKLIMQNAFPPAIAEVRKAAAEIRTPEQQVMGSEAWGEVTRAIRLYGYYRESEALASMSPRVAKVVKYLGWQEICLSEEPGVVRGQFLKMYAQVSEREQKERLLPASLRQEIQRITSSMNMKMLEGEKNDENWIS